MKKLLIFFGILVIAFSSFIYWLFQREADGVPILTYYQVNDIDKNSQTMTVEQFDAQIKYLVDDGYNIISLDELLDAWEGKKSLPNKPVVITFDDGHLENYKNVFPILKKYNAKATFFVVTDHLNLYPNCMTWEQAKELQASGLVDIESHTLSNKDLTKIYSRDKLWDQIYGSKQAIEWHLKKPAKFIAYPSGKYTREAEDMSKEVGYRAGMISDYGLSRPQPQHYILERIPIFGSNSHTFFRFYLRLKAAPIIAPLSRMKEQLKADGNGEIANFIWIP